MPRLPRNWVPGAVYHLFSRGSNRQRIFLDDGDYNVFHELLAGALIARRIDCFGWSLMPNHWHCVVRCPPDGLSAFMKQVNHRYAVRFDRRWERTAHVFENRFGAVLQQTAEQFLWTLRYVVRNPVETRQCPSPFEAQWTSVLATAGEAAAPPYLRVGEILAHFGDVEEDARRRYIEFVLATPGPPPPPAAAALSTLAA